MESSQLNECADRAKEVTEEILKLMELDGQVELLEQDESQIQIHIDSSEAGRLIGKGAQCLDALQFVVNRILLHQFDGSPKCTLDVERYRERYKDRLIEKAMKAADRVVQNGRPYTFDPMNSFDRRIVHQALDKNEEVETTSQDSDKGGWKHVVVQLIHNEQEELPEDEYEETVEDTSAEQSGVSEEGVPANEDLPPEEEAPEEPIEPPAEDLPAEEEPEEQTEQPEDELPAEEEPGNKAE